jgi:hypothetical protein
MGAGRDVEENHLIGALIVVPQREFDGVANVPETALLGTPKLHAARDFPIVDIQAWNDAFCQHFGGFMSRF